MRTSTGESYYSTTDALGSVIALTDSAQAKAATYTYDSWGTGTATGPAAAANPWRYAGGYKDNTSNLTKFGARYYNPGTGRFTQPDPSGQEQNTYAYAAANPTNNTDPSGLDAVGTIVGGIIGGAFAALGTAAVCAATAVVGCIVGAALFGAAGGAILGGLNAASDNASTETTAQQVGLGALGGLFSNAVTKLGPVVRPLFGY